MCYNLTKALQRAKQKFNHARVSKSNLIYVLIYMIDAFFIRGISCPFRISSPSTMSVKSLPDMLSATHATLSGKLPEKLLAPKVGIVCGSGLSTLADSLREVVLVPYSELEGFGKSTGARLFHRDSRAGL